MKTQLRISRPGFRLGCWLLAAGALLSALANSSAVTVAGSPDLQVAQAPQLSPGIADVLKLWDAKVDPQVIIAFVKSSTIAYNPNASELVLLKERGVPPEVMTALLERGAQLRASGVVTQPPNGSPPPAPAYSTPPTVVYPDYAYTYPYTYSSVYPYTYSSYWSDPWPYYYWPTFSFYAGWPYYSHWGYRHWGGYPYRHWGGYPYRHAGGYYPYRNWGSGSGFHSYHSGFRGGFSGGRGPYAPVTISRGGGLRSYPVARSGFSGGGGGMFRPGALTGGFSHARAHR